MASIAVMTGVLLAGCGSTAHLVSTPAASRPSSQTASVSSSSKSAGVTSTEFTATTDRGAGASTLSAQQRTTTTTSTYSAVSTTSGAQSGTPLDLHDLCVDLTLVDAQSFASSVKFVSRDALGGFACYYANANMPQDPTVGIAVYAPGHGLSNSRQAQQLFKKFMASAHASASDYLDPISQPAPGLGSEAFVSSGLVKAEGVNASLIWLRGDSLVTFGVSSVPGSSTSVAAHLLALAHHF
jgi:hypothetical protein